ncbi:MAG: RNA polymerase factor sigma-54 [Dethiobacter sp.]|nr:RNA polymerase factor sigma-54 [Dethiobacter sp.]
MRISYNLKLEQTQKLIMTPELQQAINLLQLSSLELQDFLQEELLNNPVLEVDENDESEKKNDESSEAVHEKDAIDWDQYFRDQGLDVMPRLSIRTDESPTYDHFLSKEPTLQEHLLLQLGLCRLSQTQKRIGEFLIGNIDQNGYLKGEAGELALLLGVDTEDIEVVLAVIQKFDPAGVAARNLEECLLLQMAECRTVHPLAEVIIRGHLADVAENRFKKIATDLGVEPCAVQAAVDFIRTLDPKPGRLAGDSMETRYIVPDVIVEKVTNDYVVLVNEFSTPRLTINSYYRSILGREKESVTSSFIKSKLDSALWLLRSIEQRRLTLFRVTECIVRMQRPFFDEGIKLLKAMTLKQVAEEVGVHESTVSRATANKYVQTPRGLYLLKFFFASGVEDQGGGSSISSESIKSHLREFIEAENVYRPLSDQKLTEMLKQRGIMVSRRTVAKYREELAIPASNKRKRH